VFTKKTKPETTESAPRVAEPSAPPDWRARLSTLAADDSWTQRIDELLERKARLETGLQTTNSSIENVRARRDQIDLAGGSSADELRSLGAKRQKLEQEIQAVRQEARRVLEEAVQTFSVAYKREIRPRFFDEYLTGKEGSRKKLDELLQAVRSLAGQGSAGIGAVSSTAEAHNSGIRRFLARVRAHAPRVGGPNIHHGLTEVSPFPHRETVAEDVERLLKQISEWTR